jgi:hypothetical protein
LEQKCSRVETLCAREVKGECLSQVEVCREWNNICLGYNEQRCQRYRIVENKKKCSLYGFDCNQQLSRDKNCETHCQEMQL